jgi:hypothetical protein
MRLGGRYAPGHHDHLSGRRRRHRGSERRHDGIHLHQVAVTGTDSVGASSFECSLDSAAFTACTSPSSTLAWPSVVLPYRVRPKNTVANVVPTPTTHTWTVLTPAQATQNLIDMITAVPFAPGAKPSLTAPLETALRRLTDSNPGSDMAAGDNLN